MMEKKKGIEWCFTRVVGVDRRGNRVDEEEEEEEEGSLVIQKNNLLFLEVLFGLFK